MPRLRPAAVAAAAVLVLFPGSAFAADNSRICLECHETGRHAVAEHPQDAFVANMLRPGADLPLNDGAMSCVTCHTFHGGGEPAADPSGAFWLRRTVPDLCAACHVGADGRWDRGHARYGDTIHGGTRMAPVADGTPEPAVSYDGLSRRCVACHGGGAEDHGGAAINVGISHPLRDYGAARVARADRYTPPEQLDPLVRLVEGRVSCASCHRLYGGGTVARRLVVTNRKGALCGRCHASFS